MILYALFGCVQIEKENTVETAPVDLISYVDPMQATGGIGYGVNCGFPGAAMPLGLVKLSPDSATAQGAADGFYRGGGYHYDDETIQGFSHMHLYATGITDYGVLAVMPSDGIDDTKINRKGYGLPFSHQQEKATVGLYSVELSVASVRLTASEHTGLHEYSFKPSIDPVVILDVGHTMGRGEVLSGNLEILGDGSSFQGSLIMDGEMSRPFEMFFYGEFSQPVVEYGLWSGETLLESERAEVEQGALGGWFRFAEESTVQLRVALSNVDERGAQNNFEALYMGPSALLERRYGQMMNIIFLT